MKVKNKQDKKNLSGLHPPLTESASLGLSVAICILLGIEGLVLHLTYSYTLESPGEHLTPTPHPLPILPVIRPHPRTGKSESRNEI